MSEPWVIDEVFLTIMPLMMVQALLRGTLSLEWRRHLTEVLLTLALDGGLAEIKWGARVFLREPCFVGGFSGKPKGNPPLEGDP